VPAKPYAGPVARHRGAGNRCPAGQFDLHRSVFFDRPSRSLSNRDIALRVPVVAAITMYLTLVCPE
jgi:hypothetical protein